jgi:maltose alpha-D-glucosyltransferase/alpha-amylase
MIEISHCGQPCFCENLQTELEKALASRLPRYRWFGSKSRDIRKVTTEETIAFPHEDEDAYINFYRVFFDEGPTEIYALPIMTEFGETAQRFAEEYPAEVLLNVRNRETGEEGIVYDATYDPRFCRKLISILAKEQVLEGKYGKLIPTLTKDYEDLKKRLNEEEHAPELIKGEQSNTSINYGGNYIFKLFRKLEDGLNLDVEIGRFLTERTDFENTPEAVATLEYQTTSGESIALGSLRVFAKNQGDAWKVFLERLQDFTMKLSDAGFRAGLLTEYPGIIDPFIETTYRRSLKEVPVSIRKVFSPFYEMAELLGKRTMQMHIALASDSEDPDFAPEGFSDSDKKMLFEMVQGQTEKTLIGIRKLQSKDKSLDEETRRGLETLLTKESEISSRFEKLLNTQFHAKRTRVHGDYHLGQVLFADEDFLIIDFEGEPARSLEERKHKRSPLRDVAGMLRSFHYASHVAVTESGLPEDVKKELEPWFEAWCRWIWVGYFSGYFSLSEKAQFLPVSVENTEMLLDIYLLEKALYELMYEIDNRPDWIRVPLSGILELLQ